MEPPSAARRLLVAVLAISMLMLSGTMAWAVADDLSESETVPDGVRVVRLVGAPINVSGMTRSQLSSLITTSIVDPLLQPVNVRYRTKNWVVNVRGTADPRSVLATVSVRTMVDEAFHGWESTTLASRIVSNFSGTTQTVDVVPRYSIRMDRVAARVAGIAKKIDKKPVNAVRTLEGNRIRIRPSSVGLTLDRTKAANRIKTVMVSGRSTPKTVWLTSMIKITNPKVTEKSFGKTIIVDKSERRLYLYNGAKIEKTYRVAVGMPGFPTPLGTWEIVQKRYMPVWSNPGSAWAADMPAYIPAGPSNPLGTRALNLNASGIRIHGTNKIGSIGTAASHGCIRMLRRDIEQLYELVKVGTTVYVVP